MLVLQHEMMTRITHFCQVGQLTVTICQYLDAKQKMIQEPSQTRHPWMYVGSSWSRLTRILGISSRRWDVDNVTVGQLDGSHGADLLEGLCVLELLDELDIVEFGVAHDSEMRSEDLDESTREAGCCLMAARSLVL